MTEIFETVIFFLGGGGGGCSINWIDRENLQTLQM